ncbi:MAG: hypothetical protein VB108_10665 [Anaerolineaceae bacterium]|nr:hypothetical protein [Anaerolineaceae bacterium]
MQNTIERAKRFILQDARPLDYELYRFQIGQSSKTAVLEALSAFQNEDGGFCGPLEPDNFCKKSLAMQSWKAITYLRSVGAFDIKLPMVAELVHFLTASRRADGFWNATDPETNTYPHAPWWADQGEENRVWGFNPSAEISGYLLRLGIQAESRFAEQLVEQYLASREVSMHELAGLAALYRDMQSLNWPNLPAFREKISNDLDKLLAKKPEEWESYGLRLSMFSESFAPELLEPYHDLIRLEQDYLVKTQLEDGSWKLNWDWEGNYPETWPLAKQWWKSIAAIQNIRFLGL